MKRFLALLIFAALPAYANETVALKEKITVSDGVITLGDLLQTPAAQGKTALFAAPVPGSSGTINVARAIAAAKSYGFDAIASPGLREIQVEREARKITAADIEKAIALKAAQHLRANAEDIEIDFGRTLAELNLEKNIGASLNFSSFRLEPQSGRFEAHLFVPGSAVLSEASPAVVTGTLFETAEVAQLKHTLVRGQVITKGDVELTRVKHQQLGNNMLRSLDQVVGMAARRGLSDDTILRDNDLEKAKIIDRNEMVLIVYETPLITVTTRGKALESGAIGDAIDVLNLQSKHTIQATVVGDGKVAVGSVAAVRRVAQAADIQTKTTNE
jgi:flagella basal body P-ring formation protein FlgA